MNCYLLRTNTTFLAFWIFVLFIWKQICLLKTDWISWFRWVVNSPPKQLFKFADISHRSFVLFTLLFIDGACDILSVSVIIYKCSSVIFYIDLMIKSNSLNFDLFRKFFTAFVTQIMLNFLFYLKFSIALLQKCKVLFLNLRLIFKHVVVKGLWICSMTQYEISIGFETYKSSLLKYWKEPIFNPVNIQFFVWVCILRRYIEINFVKLEEYLDQKLWLMFTSNNDIIRAF